MSAKNACVMDQSRYPSLVNADTEFRAERNWTWANDARISGKKMVKATHESFVARYDRKSCLSGTFRNRTDQLHKNMVTMQLQTISIVPRSFGEATQPWTSVEFMILVGTCTDLSYRIDENRLCI